MAVLFTYSYRNVYNSIYIPTVNCMPVVSESMDSNSSMMDDLARKYIPSADRQQYEAIAGKVQFCDNVHDLCFLLLLLSVLY